MYINIPITHYRYLSPVQAIASFILSILSGGLAFFLSNIAKAKVLRSFRKKDEDHKIPVSEIIVLSTIIDSPGISKILLANNIRTTRNCNWKFYCSIYCSLC